MGKPSHSIRAFFALLGPLLLAASLPVSADPEPQPTGVPQKLLLSYLADNSTFTLIDARTAEEFEAAHVAGAVNVPVDALDDSLERLPADRAAPIVIYCRTGRRATALREQLLDRGYTDVEVLRGDQIHWFDGMAVFNCATPSGTSAADQTASLIDGPREESQ